MLSSRDCVIYKTNFQNSPHLGVYCIANDNHALVPLTTTKGFEAIVREVLQVDVVRVSMANTFLLGIFSAACNSKIIVPSILEKHELKKLRDIFPEVIILEDKYTAVGNLVSLNDNGVAASSWLAQSLGTEPTRIAGSDFMGSAVFATNKAFLCHRDASKEELKKLEKTFKVKGDNGTINLGDPFVKTGLVGNKHGVLVGSKTTPPETLRLDEVFEYQGD